MKYQLTTRIEFCYGHRITCHEGKCVWLHGHNGLLEVTLLSDSLNRAGMVMDFSDLKQTIKQWINHNMDHAVILADFDPLVTAMRDYEQRLYLMEKEPTAENMLFEIHQGIHAQGIEPYSLTLWESANNAATIYPGC